MMINSINSTPTSRNLSGFTLVELLVSMALGLLLTAAVLQTYISTKKTVQVTDGVSRVQENARFSLFFLTRDIRNAGFSSCIARVRNKLNGDPRAYISFVEPLVGWDYNETASANTAFSLTSHPVSRPTTIANWSRLTAAGVSEGLPLYLRGRVVAGSDVVRMKSFRELDITIKTHTGTSASITTEESHEVPDGSILLVGDCSGAEVFQHLSNGGGTQVSLTAPSGNSGTPGNRATGGDPKWNRQYKPEDSIYGFTWTYFYLGEGAGGLPSLFRFRTNLPESAITPAIVAANEEELVEGVETLQVLFGEDTDAVEDQNPNRYWSASQVTDWDDIVSIRLGMLLRSPNNAVDQDQATNYQLLDSITFTHPADDLILRYAVNTTIKLRNRGLDENLAYVICDATDDDGGQDNGISECSDPGHNDGSGNGNGNGNGN